MSYKINMEKFIPASSIILTGRDKGKEARININIDELEEKNDKIILVIPDKIVSFNSSFFLGLFTPSIKKYKTKERFLEKYEFKCDDTIMEDIYYGIGEALKKTNVLE